VRKTKEAWERLKGAFVLPGSGREVSVPGTLGGGGKKERCQPREQKFKNIIAMGNKKEKSTEGSSAGD